MRIALATTEFLTEKTYDGGLSNYIYRVSLSLQSLGHEPIVFVASTKNEILDYNSLTVVRINEKQLTWWYWLLNGLTLFRLNPALLFMMRSYRMKRAILNYHRNHPIDIVHYTNAMALGIFKPRNIPSCIRISSYQKLLDEASGYKQTFRLWQKQYLQDVMLKQAKYVFGPSKIIGNHIAQKFNKEIALIETPFALDNTNTSNDRLNEINTLTQNNPYLLYFGSLTQLKGLLDIAEVLPHFFKAFPTHYFVFIGKDIGVNGQSIVTLLKEKAGTYSDRIIWYTSTPHPLLYPVIQHADLVVLPSRLDNFPNTCIEAMAFGKVVIGTYKTSFEQLIEPHISGLLCEHSNPESLMNVIDYALKMPEAEKKSIEINAQKRIKNLKPEIVVQQLVEYYQTVIKTF
jgi:glycosyltransferase involved in cell wall biosynthesis